MAAGEEEEPALDENTCEQGGAWAGSSRPSADMNGKCRSERAAWSGGWNAAGDG